MIAEDVTKGAAAAAKALDRARKALLLLAKPGKDTGAARQLALVEKALAALSGLDPAGLAEALRLERARLEGFVSEALERRRETLRRAANAAGWRVKRFQAWDRAGCFRVEYKKARVTVKLGSETLETFEEVDGDRVFGRLAKAHADLEATPFARDEFFATLKEAVGIARLRGIDRDGKVSIRALYPLVVLARQARDDAFMKRPGSRTFGEYSMCQFLYDLARFGRGGWVAGGGERLASRTPNMATIEQGGAVTLPALDGEEDGVQCAALWLERSGRG